MLSRFNAKIAKDRLNGFLNTVLTLIANANCEGKIVKKAFF